MNRIEDNKVREKYNLKLPQFILVNYAIYMPVMVVMMILFSISDIYIHENIKFAYTRIIPCFASILLFIVKFSRYKDNIIIVTLLNVILSISVLMMGVLFLIMTFNTELFSSAIYATIIFTFVVFFIAKGMRAIYISYLLPFLFVIFYFAFIIHPSIKDVQVLMNPFAIYLSVFFVNIRHEKSRYNEFFFQESLIEEKDRTEELYEETTIQNHELHQQKEEILSINEQLEQRKEELQINLEVISDLNRQLKRKNKSVTDSINYASRIQEAILPDDNEIKKIANEYFILYKPCDIVSGDFYWTYSCDDYGIVAAVDCTGHGVPGGFMSMLGFSLLNDVVQNCSSHQANEILNRLKEKLKESLNQGNKVIGQADGLDIALCIIDKKKNKVQFSGAYMPLIIYRKGEIIQYKGDKMPIGRFIKEIPSFTNHEIDFMSEDKLYMFSDGFQDQIGGADKKRFLSINLKKLIAEIGEKPFNEQKQILEQTFEKWKGSQPQMDDVLVMGFLLE